MLFRPVYGPELAAVYANIDRQTQPVSREKIYSSLFSVRADEGSISTQNVDDALSFLVAAHLIAGKNKLQAVPSLTHDPFRLQVLRQIQALTSGDLQALHEPDRLYFLILDRIFIKPDKLYVADLHAVVNRLRPVAQLGGVSHEKIRSWKRVMAYLGLGHRIGQGFQCVYSPHLILDILTVWNSNEGFIQSFLEQHLVNYLPFQTSKGGLAQSVQLPLLHLMTEGKLIMNARQDSSTKPYFGKKRLRYIAYQEEK